MPNPSGNSNDLDSHDLNSRDLASHHATEDTKVSSDSSGSMHQTSHLQTIESNATSQPSQHRLSANGSHAIWWYIVSIIVIALDQWTKWLAETKLNFHEPIPVLDPFLNWTLAYNKGAAFSFLANQPGWQKWFFAGLAFVMSIFLIIYIAKAPRMARLLNTGLALILGGAIGNLIDRIRIGKVVDFIHVHYADVWHYPIFNVADIGICIGVTIVVIDMIFLEKKRHTS